MDENFRLAELMPQFAPDRERLSCFLMQNGLRYEADIEAAFGLYDGCGELAACGCASRWLLKCFAVDARIRGQNALGVLLSALIANRFSAGYPELAVITRPENKPLFENCGFYLTAQTADAAMLENRPHAAERFAASLLAPEDAGKDAGAVVMNCNPFTLGHRALVEYAAARCEVLYLFLVEEDRSRFPFPVRERLVREGVRDIPNARVHPGGRYMISAATFPSYFLKDGENAPAVQGALDASLFAEKIAPPLGIRRRFAGEEPFCALTHAYNETMRRILPAHGIAFEEIPRMKTRDGKIISATEVRRILEAEGASPNLRMLLPDAVYSFLGSSPEFFRQEAEEQGKDGG